jgi:hypothetical protein
MAETQQGGAYRVGEKILDASGQETKLTSKARTEPAQEEVREVVYVEGVKFGSDAAGQAAKEAGLTADDFKGYQPSGMEGYTKPDVAKVLTAREAAK